MVETQHDEIMAAIVDPGMLIYVQCEHGLSVDQLDQILHKQSGLLGLSGVSSDFRQVECGGNTWLSCLDSPCVGSFVRDNEPGLTLRSR